MSDAEILGVLLGAIVTSLGSLALMNIALEERRDGKRWAEAYSAKTFWGLTMWRPSDYTPRGRRYLCAFAVLQLLLAALVVFALVRLAPRA